MTDVNNTINTETLSALEDTMGEVFEDLKIIFLEDTPVLLDQIKEGLNNKQMDVISTAAHTLKSSAKNMGADKLADYCIQIENNININDGAELPALYKSVVSEMYKVREFFESS